MRSHYWTNSAFADWVRGTKNPTAATSDGWREWERGARAAHSFRYWLAEDAIGAVQTAVFWPTDKLYSIKYYINNRWVTKTHQLTAHKSDIKPGGWRDVGNRFLPCMFNELVDFVEIETAWQQIAWGKEEDRIKYDAPFWATGWFRWRTWRSAQAGLDHLAWAQTLTNDEYLEPGHKDYGKPTPQAVNAKEIQALYTWWKEVYPKRPDPHDASGWSAICEERRLQAEAEDGFKSVFWGEDKTPAEKKASRKALDLCQKIEKQYNDEDTEMLIRLIKIRDSLWT